MVMSSAWEPTMQPERRRLEATTKTLVTATEPKRRPPEEEAGIRRAEVELE